MVFAVILAGGVGTRMGRSIPKQYIEVEGKPVLVHTLEKFQDCEIIDRITIVADNVWRDDIQNWLKQYGITKFLDFADPGATRQESVFSGVACCKKYAETPNDIVLVHESARPLVTLDMIRRIVDGLESYDACIPVMPMKDAILLSKTGELIDGLLDRNQLFRGQAPESFRLLPYYELNRQTPPEELGKFLADHELCFHNGWRVHCIIGEETNFKLTTPDDIEHMISLLQNGVV